MGILESKRQLYCTVRAGLITVVGMGERNEDPWDPRSCRAHVCGCRISRKYPYNRSPRYIWTLLRARTKLLAGFERGVPSSADLFCLHAPFGTVSSFYRPTHYRTAICRGTLGASHALRGSSGLARV